MLISRVVEDNGVSDVGGGGEGLLTDHSHEFETANELFELFSPTMERTKETEALSQRDVVLLYKNLEVGSHITSNSEEVLRNPTNQYVESIVYKDDENEENSDLLQICSNEDFCNVFDINNERINLFSKISSGNALCNKLGNTQLQSTFMTSDYAVPFFRPNNCQDIAGILTRIDDLNVLPNTLTDYIACKKMEDTFTVCLENVILYVQHTIEHLQKISDGEFLTDRVKERWIKTENVTELIGHVKNHHHSPSLEIPSTTVKWGDLIRSDADVMSKVLRRIVVGVPHILSGRFELISKYCDDSSGFFSLTSAGPQNFTKKRVMSAIKDYKVNIVFDMTRSRSSFFSEIRSILFLKHPSRVQLTEMKLERSLFYARIKPVKVTCTTPGIGQVGLKTATAESLITFSSKESNYMPEKRSKCKPSAENPCKGEQSMISQTIDSISRAFEVYTKNANIDDEDMFAIYPDDSEENILIDLFDLTDVKSDYPHAEVDCFTVQQLTQKSPLDSTREEDDVTKKKSGPARIKSPYENKSLMIEEKKRKKLLEIKEKREKKKQALETSGKVQKNKCDKGFIKSQPSNSVTALSITNKAFYNSIYGRNSAPQKRYKKLKRPLTSNAVKQTLSKCSLDGTEYSSLCTELNDNKYINRSFFLDEIETGIMQTEIKRTQDFLPLCSAVLDGNVTDEMVKSNVPTKMEPLNKNLNCTMQGAKIPFTCSLANNAFMNETSSEQSIDSLTNADCSHDEEENDVDLEKVCDRINPLGFIKSIDKIYDMLKKFDPVRYSDAGDMKTKHARDNNSHIDYVKSTAPENEVMSNSRHRNESPDRRLNIEKSDKLLKKIASKNDTIIAKPKSQHKAGGSESEIPSINITGDPMMENKTIRTISQLIQEIDKVQKRSIKQSPEKLDTRQYSRNNSKRPFTRFDVIPEREVLPPQPTTTNRTPRARQKFPTSLLPKPVDKQPLSRKNLEITDEQKEARGEAVKGPPAISRIDALAKPRKLHIMAHKDETMNRIQRVPTDRQNKKATEKKLVRKVKSPPLTNKPSETALKKPLKDDSDVTLSLINANLNQISAPPTNVWRQRPLAPAALVTVAGQTTASTVRAPRKPSTSTLTTLPYTTEEYSISQSKDILYKKKTTGEQKLNPLMPNNNSSFNKTKVNKFVNMMSVNTTSAADLATNNLDDHSCNFIPKIHVTYRHVVGDDNQKMTVDYRTKLIVENEDDKSIETVDGVIGSKISSEHVVVSHRQKSSGDYHVPVKVSVALTPKNSLQQVAMLHSGDASMIFPSNNKKSELSNFSAFTRPFLNLTSTDIPMQISTIGYAITNLYPSMAVKVAQNCTSTSSIPTIESNNISNKTTQFNGALYSLKSNSSFLADRMLTYPNADNQNNSQQTASNTLNVVDKKISNTAIDIGTSSCKIFDGTRFHESAIQTKDEQISNNNIEGDEHSTTTYSEVKVNDKNNSHSLDVLVGLLNEIHNITTCQTKITNPSHEKCDNFETMTLYQEKPCERNTAIISMPSYDVLEHVESNPSLYSLYMSRNCSFIEKETSKSRTHLQSEIIQTLRSYEDKAIGNDIKQFVDRFSDVQSMFSIKNVSVQVFDEKSSTSLFTFFAYQPQFLTSTNSSFVLKCDRGKSISETTKPFTSVEKIDKCNFNVYNAIESQLNDDSNRAVDILMPEPTISSNHELSKIKKSGQNISQRKSEAIISLGRCPDKVIKYHRDNESKDRVTHNATSDVQFIKEKAKIKLNITKNEKHKNVVKSPEVRQVQVNGIFDKEVHEDPTIYMKRDILVAVYSVLVVTVFAALSFPGLV